MPLAPGPEDFVCSARECTQGARWKITWSNPGLPFGRQKVWLACGDHLDHLKGYFEYRNFPFQVEAFTEP